MVNFSNVYRTWVAPIMFVACIALVCCGPAKAATATVPECHHNAAPIDTGRYAKDLLVANKIVTTQSVPKGTQLTMAYRLKNGQIKEITCITSEELPAVLLEDGKIYYQGCGNDILSGVTIGRPVAVASAPVSAASAPCTTDGCGNTTQTVTRTTVFVEKVVKTCPGSSSYVPVDTDCPAVVIPAVHVRLTPPVSECMNCGARQPVVSPQTSNCESLGSGTRVCRGSPPAGCGCYMTFPGKVGVYFPNVASGTACVTATAEFTRARNITIR